MSDDKKQKKNNGDKKAPVPAASSHNKPKVDRHARDLKRKEAAKAKKATSTQKSARQLRREEAKKTMTSEGSFSLHWAKVNAEHHRRLAEQAEAEASEPVVVVARIAV